MVVFGSKSSIVNVFSPHCPENPKPPLNPLIVSPVTPDSVENVGLAAVSKPGELGLVPQVLHVAKGESNVAARREVAAAAEKSSARMELARKVRLRRRLVGVGRVVFMDWSDER